MADPFEIGDVLICVEEPDYFNYLEAGELYVVVDYAEGDFGPVVYVDGNNCPIDGYGYGPFKVYRFEKVGSV